MKTSTLFLGGFFIFGLIFASITIFLSTFWGRVISLSFLGLILIGITINEGSIKGIYKEGGSWIGLGCGAALIGIYIVYGIGWLAIIII